MRELDDRGLSCAVRPEKSEDRAGFDLEAHAVDSPDATSELLYESTDLYGSRQPSSSVHEGLESPLTSAVNLRRPTAEQSTMPDDAFFEVVLRQRACRSFESDPVGDEVIGQLLEAATHAPSAENRQPWLSRWSAATRFAKRSSIFLRAWDSGAREHSTGRLDERLLAEVDEGARGGVASAPVLVVVCGDTEKSHPQALASSIFPAVQNLLLAAGAVGLGSALTTLAVIDRGGISTLLDLPSHVVPMAIVPLGWPARTLGPPRRGPSQAKTDRDMFGTPW